MTASEGGRSTGAKRRRCTHVAGVVLVAVSLPALAQDAAGERWQYELTPYIWASGLDGKVRINGRPQAGLGVEQSFSDILKTLDFAAMASFEARKGRWGVMADAVYFRVSDEGALAGRGGLASLDAQATMTLQMHSLGVSYRAIEGDAPVDVVGGLRYNSVKWDVDIQASVPVLPPASRRFTEREHWVDPYIGARIKMPLDERWALVGYADVGGFGVGSRFAAQAVAGALYAFRPNLVGKFGYRYTSVDYDESGFKYDMSSAGLYAGVGFSW